MNDDDIKLNYSIDYLKSLFEKENKSFIKDIFAFELMYHCKYCNSDYDFIPKYMLYLCNKNDNLKEQRINLYTILSEADKCINCKNKVKLNFKTFPKILIVAFSTNLDIKYNYQEKIELEHFPNKKNKVEYFLISMILKCEKNYETYCKLTKWNLYEEKEKKQLLKPINQLKTIVDKKSPLLLIYRKL